MPVLGPGLPVPRREARRVSVSSLLLRGRFILRQCGDRVIIFGELAGHENLHLPPDGHDVLLVANLVAQGQVHLPCKLTWNMGPEDIIEEGIPTLTAVQEAAKRDGLS